MDDDDRRAATTDDPVEVVGRALAECNGVPFDGAHASAARVALTQLVDAGWKVVRTEQRVVDEWRP
jgi:hypothetical protein